ncbi:hypothetical protein ACJX0J_034614, partial [Zea mays]
VPHVMSQVSKKQEEYLGHLIIVLGVIKFILLKGLAFHGHDEGNFFEWDKKFRKIHRMYLEVDVLEALNLQKFMLTNLIQVSYHTDRHTVFPLVYRLFELALILPVATATICEIKWEL